MNRIILSLTALFIFATGSKAQTYFMPTVGLQNTYAGACMVSTCSGTFYDDGGAGANYSNGITSIYRTFCPNTPGNALTITFTSFSLEPSGFFGCYDLLEVKNGPTQNSTTVASGCGTSLLGYSYTATNASGCISIRFTSDAGVNRPGWVATLSCTPAAGMPTGLEDADCINATGICDNGFSLSGATNGPGLVSDACTGCTVSENFSNWYEFTIATSGNLGLTLTPTPAANDYDFALYLAPDCASLGVPVRCSYAANSGTTGMNGVAVDVSEDVTGDAWVSMAPVVAGEHYYLLVNEWSPTSGSFVLDWTGTATIATPLPLTFIGATDYSNSSYTVCAGTPVTITANGSGGTYSWYLVPTGGAAIATGINYSPSTAAAGTTTYYLQEVTPNGCTSARTPITIIVNAAATVNAGPDQTVCSTSPVATMAGSFGGGASSVTWTTSGTGSFSSSTSTTSTYTPSAADIAAGTVTLTLTTNDPAGPCGAVSDAMILTINPAATVNAGPDQTICAGSTATLSGSRGGGASSSTWTTSGTGSFSNASILNPVYTPSAADISAGTVTLTLTTNDPAGPCGFVSDFMVLTINPAATVNAGADQTICAGSTVSLTGSMGGSATSVTWTTSGTGSFASSTSTNTTYTPSAADVSAGTVTLTLTTNDPAGPCGAVSDAMVVTINAAATVNAGADQTICSGSTATMAGTMGGSATTITWTTSGTGTFSSTSSLTAVYTPSAVDIAAGTVTLTITTNDPAGPCGPVSDNLILTINPAATANAGPDQTICSGTTATMSGSIGGGATTLNWTTSGTGTFSSSTSASAVYTPSAADIAAGTVTLTITTNDPAGPCGSATDNMVLTINPAATVNAGPDQTICAGSTATLSGSRGGGASSSTWTTSGTGSFSNASILNPVYTPSAADISAGTVTLTLTTNDPAGPCGAVSDAMVLTITPLQNANFSYASATYCQTGVNPTPTVTGVAGGTFTSSPAGLSINAATGTINLAASALGVYTVTYTTPGPCPNSSNVSITITGAPSATFSYAGPYCQDGVDPFPTFPLGSSAGTFSSTAGLVFVNVNTGQVDLSASTPGTYTVTNNIAASGGCAAASANNTITINQAATVNAGTDQTICAGTTATMAGSVGGSATTLTWTTSGTGTFSSSTSATAVYTPSAADIAAGTVTITITSNDPAGVCAAVTDNMVITINTAATANAGPDQTICAGTTATMAGSVGGSATTLTWTTSGTGTFSSSTSATAVYTPSAADIVAGTVTITITSNDPAGPCAPVTDVMILTINPAAVVSAGADQTICAGSTATMAGVMAGGASSITWTTSGTGTFSSTTSLTAVYTPSAADIAAGTVTLTITSNDPAGPCGSNSDAMVLTINPAATVNAGADQTICSGSIVTLSGTQGGSTTSTTWTSSGTGTFSNAASLTSTYTPSAADVSAGTVTLTITSNDPAGPCNAVTDVMIITINPAATVSAGVNATICSGSTFTTAGTFGGGATSGTWTTSGTGTFAAPGSAVTTYTPSAADIAAGTVSLTFTTNNPPGPCGSVSDIIILTINPAATVNAGPDQGICSGSIATLAGTMGGGASSVTWTTSGSGTFSSTTSTTPTYTPSAADISAGTVTLTITSDNPAGPCNAVSDVMILTISPAPTVSAGVNASICSGSNFTTAGSFGGGASSVTWTTSGTGSFAVATSAVTTYVPSAADVAAGSVTLTLTTNDPAGPCTSIFASILLTIDPAATVTAGADGTICSGNTFNTGGAFGGSASSVTWTTSGTGTFSSATSAITTYTPSAADISAGTVTLTITTNDPVGACGAVSDAMVLTINPTPSFTVGPLVNPSACGASDGSITISGLNPSTTYTITYDDASGTVNLGVVTTTAGGTYVISGLPAGGYSNFTVTLGSCTGTSAGSVSLTDPSAPTFTVGATFTNPTTCGGTDGTITLTGLNPSTSYNVSYDNSGGTVVVGSITTNASGNLIITGLPADTYTNFVLTLTGCTGSNSATVTLTDPASPTFTLGAVVNTSACAASDGTITLTGLSPSTTYTISYNNGSVVNLGSVTTDASGNYMITGLTAGTYTAFTVTNAAGCTVVDGTFIVITDPAPPSFSAGATFTNPTTCGGNDGTITLTGMNPSSSYDISYDGPSGTVSLGTITTDASGNYIITGLTAGAYTNITVTATGCNTVSPVTVSLSDPGAPTFAVGVFIDPTTCGGTDGSITLTGLTPSTTYTITYDNGSVVTLGAVTSDGAGNYIITGLSAGTYTGFTVSLAGCTSSDNTIITLVDPTPPSFTVTLVTNPSACGLTDGSVTLTGLIPSTTYTVTYDTTGGTVILGSVTSDASGNILITGLGAGSYTNFTVTLNGCTTTDVNFFTLTDPGAPVFSVSGTSTNPTTCGGTDGTITITGLTPSTSYDITYFNGISTVNLGTVTTDGAGNFIITGLPAGSYSNISVTFSGCNTVDPSTVTLTDPGAPTAPIAGTDATYCAGNAMLNMTATVAAGGTITWYSDAALTVIIATGTTLAPGTTPGVTVYYVTETAGGCESAASTVTITINTPPSTAPTVPALTSFCSNAMGAITATPLSGGTINWYSDSLLTALSATGNSFIPPSTVGITTYYVTEAIGGCNSTYTATIVNVIDCDTIPFFVPTGFTPDGDGTNDVWDIQGLSSKYPECKVEVFTRWGAKIFVSDTGYTTPWDGTYRNNKMPLGAYYFVIYFNDGTTDPMKGTVTIIR